jgi:uncharacterized protein
MPRPYGPIGLLVSLVAILVLAVVYFLVAVGAAILIDAGAQGFAHVAQVGGDFVSAVRSGELEPWFLPIFAAGAPLYLALLGAVVTVAAWRGGHDWRSLVAWLPWSPRKAGKGYWGLVAGGVVYGVAASVALSLAYPQTEQWSQLPRGVVGVAVSFVVVVLAAPLTEEVLFRGWIFTSLRARFSFWPANIASAAAFAIAHWESTHLYAVAVFPLGLMLGLAREETGSTRASAAFHAIYNAIALTLSLVGPS